MEETNRKENIDEKLDFQEKEIQDTPDTFS